VARANPQLPLGAGQQQVRRVWCNVGAFRLNLWSLVAVTAGAERAKDWVDRRGSPWDRGARRPSVAACRKALRRRCLAEGFQRVPAAGEVAPKMANFARRLMKLVA
jgi:hypothetical protein